MSETAELPTVPLPTCPKCGEYEVPMKAFLGVGEADRTKAGEQT